MPFMIDGETYYEDITLTQEQFYQRLKDNSDISTSQPTPDSIMKLWDELLKEYDQIVHIPMSAGLSGSCATAMMLAGEDEYEGNVFVVDNHRISVTQYQSVKDAMMLADMGMDGAQIKKRLEETAADSVIFGGHPEIPEKRRTHHTGGRGSRHTFKDQAGPDYPGRKAGFLCKGPHDEAGEDTDDECDPERAG